MQTLSSILQPIPVRGLSAPLQAELVQDAVDMRFGRGQPDIEAPGDFLVAEADRNQIDDLAFARG